ncbi:MAG: hypothetical protein PVI90_00230 [Desulfobacteraceae bacterium]|jgi:hypothetical protein
MSITTYIEDQRRGDTHRERFLKLQTELRAFTEEADSKQYETVLYRFLTEFERLRLNTENQILKLYKEISFCEGTSRACITVANTLVSVLRRYREELQRKPPTQVSEEIQPKEEKGNIVTDTEKLKTICICGCQDEEDAANCSCSCHKGIPCDDERCVVCKAKKEELKRTAVTKNNKVKKKTPSSKKTTKKKTNKKKISKRPYTKRK